MNKSDEIKVLQSLKGDTYFNQFFSSSDIDIMCENIRNDFAIESGCAFNGKVRSIQRTLNEVAKNQEECLKSLACRFIDCMNGETIGIDGILEDMTSHIEIIKYKRSKCYLLSDRDIDYLIEKANK